MSEILTLFPAAISPLADAPAVGRRTRFIFFEIGQMAGKSV
jgi:hypothetical protein